MPMGVVQNAGVETVLPNVAGGALRGIAVGGDPNLALFAERANQSEEMMAVLVGSFIRVVCCCPVG